MSMTTELLYNADAYLTEFDGQVLECLPASFGKLKGFNIILDRTVFFPEQGGQDSDMGSLTFAKDDETEAVRILHASIKDNIIYHFSDQPLEPGTQVHGLIDWADRYEKMQQHSGEHLLSGFISSHFGFDNVGFHLGAEDVTVDFNGIFTDEDLNFIEDSINKAIYANFESHIFWPTKEELAALPYRSKKEIEGDIRIVEFPGYDMCACCAPHVRRTGEIGIFKIISAEHFRGGTRMSVKCGSRALKDYRRLLSDAREISHLLSAKLPDISSAVSNLADTNGKLKFSVNELERKLFDLEMAKAIDNGSFCIVASSCNPDVARMTVNSMSAHTDAYAYVYVGDVSTGYKFFIASQSQDCRQLLDKLKTLGAKGGGSEHLIQGTIDKPYKEN